MAYLTGKCTRVFIIHNFQNAES